MEADVQPFIQESKVDLWKQELKKYTYIFEKNRDLFKDELKIIQECYQIIEKKISIAFIGPPKAGKSRFLNSMIGKEYLQTDDQNCTFFGLKIQPTFNSPVLFTKNDKKNDGIKDEDAIKKNIKEINLSERQIMKKTVEKTLLKTSTKIWTLQTPIKAFSRNGNYKTRREAYDFIELYDLPGISDYNLKFTPTDIAEHFDIVNEYESKSGLEMPDKLKFNEIIKTLDLDIIVLLLEVSEMKNIKEFFQYFKKSLFQGEQRAKFKEILEKNNLLIVVNKADLIEKNTDEEIKEKKNEILHRIFKEFNLGVEFWNKNNYPKKSEIEEDYESFLKNHMITFTSAEIAFASMVFAQSNIDDIKKNFSKRPEIIEKKIEEKRKQYELTEKYHKDSGFEEFVDNLSKKINSIFNDKIENEIEAKLDYFKRRKKIFDGLHSYLKDNEQGYLKSHSKEIEYKLSLYMKEKQNNFEDDMKKIYCDFDDIYKRYQKIIDIKSKYYDFVKECSLLIKSNKEKAVEKYSNYASSIMELFPNLPNLKEFLDGKLNYYLNEIRRKNSKRIDEILYSFLPDDIDYFRIWIIWKIVSFFTKKDSFERKWKSFLIKYHKRVEHIQKNMKEDFEKEFNQKLVSIVMEMWDLAKKVNNF